jgi:hypothetical protein
MSGHLACSFGIFFHVSGMVSSSTRTARKDVFSAQTDQYSYDEIRRVTSMSGPNQERFLLTFLSPVAAGDGQQSLFFLTCVDKGEAAKKAEYYFYFGGYCKIVLEAAKKENGVAFAGGGWGGEGYQPRGWGGIDFY